MRTIVILVLLGMPVDDSEGAESASPAAKPVMLGIAAGYPDDEGIGKDPAVILYEDYKLPNRHLSVKCPRDTVLGDLPAILERRSLSLLLCFDVRRRDARYPAACRRDQYCQSHSDSGTSSLLKGIRAPPHCFSFPGCN